MDKIKYGVLDPYWSGELTKDPWWFNHPFIVTFLLVLAITAMVSLLFFIQWNTGEDIYTGYIYSTEDFFGKTSAHIRFSENAGADSQPSFCVSAEDAQMVKELSGSGIKVKVTIPAGFSIAPPWICAIPAKVEVME